MTLANTVNTFCVNEPSSKTTGIYVDSVGDRLMPRLEYRNFGTYQSFLDQPDGAGGNWHESADGNSLV